ncbi:MAG: S8 family serine peptidase [Firmicutes bacterium]|nr:S8 family serine peptidase [Bacillota bacterium]
MKPARRTPSALLGPALIIALILGLIIFVFPFSGFSVAGPADSGSKVLRADAAGAGSKLIRPLGLAFRSAADRRAVLLADEPPVSYQGTRPGQSLELTREEIAARSLTDRTGYDGSGVTIAIIDTGIDVSHPDLRLASGGQVKIVDWVDFTDEGLVLTGSSVSANGRLLQTALGRLILPESIRSKSGNYRYGFLNESQLDEYGYIGRDLNRNGRRDDRFPVVLVDSGQAGVYDRVLVDTDRDGSLTDEVALSPYSESRGFAYFDPEQTSSFVVAGLQSEGGWVRIGFDGNGHGTHVAGIAAANGAVKGIAPGARLMAIKALGSSGDGTWAAISEAILYAAVKGADIISISVGSLGDPAAGDREEADLIADLERRYGTIFVLAVGNTGPGLASTATPNRGSNAIVAGAYVSARLWDLNYGYTVPDDTLWFFSSVGPRHDGSLAPHVVAPGSANSTVPRWDGGGYAVLEGTSMAAPHVAGGIALLIQGAKKSGINYNPQLIRRALEESASPLPSYQAVEQGRGKLNISRAWRFLPYTTQVPGVSIEGTGDPSGLLIRDYAPAMMVYNLRNPGRNDLMLELSGSESWLIPKQPRLILPAQGSRRVAVSFDPPAGQGLYSAFLTGNAVGGSTPGGDGSAPGGEVNALITMVRAENFSSEKGYAVVKTGSISAAGYRRYYFDVPAGTGELLLNLRVPADSQGQARGRVRMHVTQPDGRELALSEYAGLDATAGNEVIFPVKDPDPGVWEVVVYSSPGLSRFGRLLSEYQLRVSVKGIYAFPELWRAAVPSGNGSKIAADFILTNAYGDFRGRATGVGLAPVAESASRESLTVLDRGTVSSSVFTVDSRDFYLKAWIDSAEKPESDLDLFLLHENPESGEWEEVASSITVGSSTASLEVLNPLPGRYRGQVEGFYVPGLKTQVDFHYRTVRDAGNVRADDVQALHRLGGTWTLRAELTPPRTPGEYFGYFFVQDQERGLLLSKIPIQVSVGRPELLVTVAAGPLRIGDEAVITIGLRERSTLREVAADVTVNGLLYRAGKGGLTVPLPVKEGAVSVRVSVDAPGHSPLEQDHRIPVAEGAPVGSRTPYLLGQEAVEFDQQGETEPSGSLETRRRQAVSLWKGD